MNEKIKRIIDTGSRAIATAGLLVQCASAPAFAQNELPRAVVWGYGSDTAAQTAAINEECSFITTLTPQRVEEEASEPTVSQFSRRFFIPSVIRAPQCVELGTGQALATALNADNSATVVIPFQEENNTLLAQTSVSGQEVLPTSGKSVYISIDDDVQQTYGPQQQELVATNIFPIPKGPEIPPPDQFIKLRGFKDFTELQKLLEEQREIRKANRDFGENTPLIEVPFSIAQPLYEDPKIDAHHESLEQLIERRACGPDLQELNEQVLRGFIKLHPIGIFYTESPEGIVTWMEVLPTIESFDACNDLAYFPWVRGPHLKKSMQTYSPEYYNGLAKRTRSATVEYPSSVLPEVLARKSDNPFGGIEPVDLDHASVYAAAGITVIALAFAAEYLGGVGGGEYMLFADDSFGGFPRAAQNAQVQREQKYYPRNEYKNLMPLIRR